MHYYYFLPITLLIVVSLSLLITYLSINFKKTAIQVVNDMGFGWNLANSFDCYSNYQKISTPDEQITLWANPIPTKNLIISIKKYGFKTIRFPVTWMHFMDDNGNVNPEWMSRVKEVVDWITESKMYCILNIYNDGVNGNWLSEGLKTKEKYITLWTQIANEFRNYDEYLVFESMDEVEFKIGNNYDYLTLLILNQAFIDVIRNSGGNNSDRLLIVSGMKKDPEITCSSEYKMPVDPSRKFAVSIYYYQPLEFTIESSDNPWSWVDSNGNIQYSIPLNDWGGEKDYKFLFNYFQIFKEQFIEKGIPIIISEVGVLTEDKKDPESIREFLFAEFSMSALYDGIMSCLKDTSNKKYSNMNYYDRINEKFFDEKIGDNFIKISEGNYAKLTDFSIFCNEETESTLTENGYIKMKFDKKKVKKITFNAKIKYSIIYVSFGIVSNDKYGNYFSELIEGGIGKRKYDGTYIYTIEPSKKNYFNDYIELQIWYGKEYITLNYMNIEFYDKFICFDYNKYKNSLK